MAAELVRIAPCDGRQALEERRPPVAPAAARHDVSFPGEEKHGPGQLLRDAGRGDSQDSSVPAVRGIPRFDHDCVARRVEPVREPREHEVDDALLNGAALVVRLLDLARENLGARGVGRRQQLEGARRVVEAPHGVQAGRDAKGDFARGRRAPGGNAGAAQESRETGSSRVRETREAPRDEDAVLARERDHVGDRRERRDLREGGEPAAAARRVDARRGRRSG